MCIGLVAARVGIGLLQGVMSEPRGKQSMIALSLQIICVHYIARSESYFVNFVDNAKYDIEEMNA